MKQVIPIRQVCPGPAPACGVRLSLITAPTSSPLFMRFTAGAEQRQTLRLKFTRTEGGVPPVITDWISPLEVSRCGASAASVQTSLGAVEVGVRNDFEVQAETVPGEIFEIWNGTLELFDTVEDLDVPSTAIRLEPAPNAAGWNNSDVTVTLTATDPSGIREIRQKLNDEPVALYVEPFVLSREAQTVVTFFAVDGAGNYEPPECVTIKIDKTAPQTRATVGATDRKVTLEASDGGSGVKEIRYRQNNGSFVVVPGDRAELVAAAGTTSVTFFAVDVAGNEEPQQTIEIGSGADTIP